MINLSPWVARPHRILPPFRLARSISLIRICQPDPVARSAVTTSISSRSFAGYLGASCFGRPGLFLNCDRISGGNSSAGRDFAKSFRVQSGLSSWMDGSNFVSGDMTFHLVGGIQGISHINKCTPINYSVQQFLGRNDQISGGIARDHPRYANDVPLHALQIIRAQLPSDPEPNRHLPFYPIERQATLIKLKSPVLPPAGFSLPKGLVMDEGFPPHTVGFMRRKREKEQDNNERGEKPSQS